jgi:hypothetical protein
MPRASISAVPMTRGAHCAPSLYSRTPAIAAGAGMRAARVLAGWAGGGAWARVGALRASRPLARTAPVGALGLLGRWPGAVPLCRCKSASAGAGVHEPMPNSQMPSVSRRWNVSK